MLSLLTWELGMSHSGLLRKLLRAIAGEIAPILGSYLPWCMIWYSLEKREGNGSEFMGFYQKSEIAFLTLLSP